MYVVGQRIFFNKKTLEIVGNKVFCANLGYNLYPEGPELCIHHKMVFLKVHTPASFGDMQPNIHSHN